MSLKLLTAMLIFCLAVESVYLLKHRHPTNSRFRPLEGYDGIVAFDTATGQLCKTLRTRSAAEIEHSGVEPATKTLPCPLLPQPSGDSVLDKINRFGISKTCGGAKPARESDDESMIEFVVKLPFVRIFRRRSRIRDTRDRQADRLFGSPSR